MSRFDIDKFNTMVEQQIVTPLIDAIHIKKPDVYRNTLDPFSAMVDCAVSGCTHSEWMEREIARQSQKTLQNKVGDFHENVIGCFDNWDNLPVGKIFDIINKDEKIIAEVKNKHNTTKGNHKKEIYDALASVLDGNYEGYRAYYVEILPKNRDIYNECFTPPDNVTKTNREAREDIRKIDGKSFYEIVSGDPDFVHKLYNEHLPKALSLAIENIRKAHPEIKLPKFDGLYKDKVFMELIDNTYQ